MQKILFNDKYGLTKAVLEGKKTQTRRLLVWNTFKSPMSTICQGRLCVSELYHQDETSRFAVGEVLAIAQPLKDLGYNADDKSGGHIYGLKKTAAWKNKMFVSASQCKSHIRITGIRLERLQDISEEDCLKEGIESWDAAEEYYRDKGVRKSIKDLKASGITPYQIPGCWACFTSPKAAYAYLIDKISGKGTWEKNPWVFVYDFELTQTC